MRGSWLLLAVVGLMGCGNIAAEGRFPRNRSVIPPGVRVSESNARKAVDVGGIRSDLFGAPVQEKPVSRPATPPPPPPVTPSSPPPDPLAGWEYVGDVEIGGEQLALVERKDTKEGIYLRVGESFGGGTVTAFDKQRVAVAMADSDRALARKDDWRFSNPRASGQSQVGAAAEKTVTGDLLSLSDTKAYATEFLLRTKMLRNGGHDQMKNQVFEGQMSVQDFDKKAAKGASFYSEVITEPYVTTAIKLSR